MPAQDMEEYRAVWMVERAKIYSLMAACDSFLQILNESQLLKAGENNGSEVIEGLGAIWMARRQKTESLTVACDGFLQILHLSQLPKAGGNGTG
jgi:hypothetical protein